MEHKQLKEKLVITIFCSGRGVNLKLSLLPGWRVTLFSALPPLKATSEEEERDGAEGSGSQEFLGAGADAHLDEKNPMKNKTPKFNNLK